MGENGHDLVWGDFSRSLLQNSSQDFHTPGGSEDPGSTLTVQSDPLGHVVAPPL